MRYYCVVELDVTDPAWVADYVKEVTKLIEANGGRYLARTSKIEKLEGARQAPQTFVIIEWPSRDAAVQFYQSDEYQPYLNSRLAGAATELTLIAGEDMTHTAQIAD